MTDDQQIYEAAIARFGVDAQIDMLVEECAELIMAIQHRRRGRLSWSGVAEEAADVLIMLGQLKVIIGRHEIEAQRQVKLDRLRQRIEKRKHRGNDGN